MKRKKSVSDDKLNRLWSEAVKMKYRRCPVTGESDREKLQPHHIVPKGRQNRFPLRWEIRNGVPLRTDVHRAYHDGDLDIAEKIHHYVKERGDWEYLQGLRHKLKHDFLASIGRTEDEYRRVTADYLQSIIDSE